MKTKDEHKANNALGIFVICLMLLPETFFADRHFPHPASPYVWSVLAAVGLGSLAYYVRFRIRSRGRRDEGPPR